MTQGSWSGAPSPPYFSRSKRSEKESSSDTALPAALPIVAKAFEAVRQAEHAVGHVERDHGDRDAALKHDVGRLGIDVDVELGGGRDVADLEIGAAPSSRSRGCAAAMSGALTSAIATLVSGPSVQSVTVARLFGAERVDDEIDAVLRPRASSVGSGRSGPSRPVGPWTCSAVTSFRAHRPLAAGIDRHVGAPGQLDDLEGVPRVLGEADIAGDGDDAEDVELLRRGQRKEERHGVVLAGIGVDDDLSRHALPSSRSVTSANGAGETRRRTRDGFRIDPSRFRRRRYPRRRSPGPR